MKLIAALQEFVTSPGARLITEIVEVQHALRNVLHPATLLCIMPWYIQSRALWLPGCVAVSASLFETSEDLPLEVLIPIGHLISDHGWWHYRRVEGDWYLRPHGY